MNKLTQHEGIIKYIEKYGSILPAKKGGEIMNFDNGYYEVMFGSETSKRCRELRSAEILKSEKDGKFERFYLTKRAGGKKVGRFTISKPKDQVRPVNEPSKQQSLFNK